MSAQPIEPTVWPPTVEDLELLRRTSPDIYELAIDILEQQAAARDSDRREPLPDSPGALAMKVAGRKHIQRAHHNLIDEQFMQGETEGGKRVIINIGPRYGKTNQLRWGCAHRVARNPDRRIIYASYSADLAEDSSRWVRDQLEAHDLGPRPRRDSRAVDRWWIEGHDGGMLAAGIGGGITGFGADDLVIDDVHKNHEEAHSKTMRDKVWRWYTQTAYDRLEPGANVWIVMTRWHPDDLTGRLLKEQPGVWTVIRIPTIALPGDPLGRAPGELLWPERYDQAEVEAQRTTLGPFGFGARHQQDPKVNTGGVFDEDLLMATRVPDGEAPTLTRKCVALDPSASDEGRDEAGITVQGVGTDGHAYVLEDLSARLDPDAWARRTLLACLRHDCDLVYESNLTPVFIRRTIKGAWEQLQRDWLALRRHRDGQLLLDDDAWTAAAEGGLDQLLDRPGLGLMPAMKPVRAMVGKQLRAEPVAQVFRQKRAHLVGSWPALEAQMVSWRPGDDSPDRLDAMVHGITYLVDKSAQGEAQAASPAHRQLPRVGPIASTVGGRARVR